MCEVLKKKRHVHSICLSTSIGLKGERGFIKLNMFMDQHSNQSVRFEV